MAKSGFVKPPSADALKVYLGKELVEVGILENAPDYPDGTPILEVAAYTEFGGDGGNPPAYHWLRKSAKIDHSFHRKQIIAALKHPAGSIRTGLLHALGKRSVELIADHVENNDIGMQSNKESTQKRKGGDTPMVDTKHMIQSLDYRVGK